MQAASAGRNETTTTGRLAKHGSLAAVSAFLIAACTVSHSVVGTRHTVTVTAFDESMILNEANNLDASFTQSGALLYDRNLQVLLVEVAGRLLSARKLPQHRIRIRVIPVPAINAFALANGTIYLTTGLLLALQTEDDLAAILAHEIEHVVGRHAVRDFRVTSMQTAFLSLGVMALGSMVPKTDREDAGEGTKPAEATEIAKFFTARNYTRSLEREADLSSVRTLLDAGYRPDAMSMALEQIYLASPPGGETPFEWQADHPDLLERIHYCRKENERLQPGSTGDNWGKDPHYRALVEAAVRGR